MEWIEGLVKAVNGVLWDYVLLFLLVATGVYFTVRLGFVQLRKFGDGMRRLFGNISLKGARAGKDGMSSFQALTTAIAAQVGTGNIAGCAVALATGGAGAIFWMWVSAFFGMATIYGEAVLAQTYRTTVDGQVTGGPIYYIRAVFQGKFGKFLAGFFSIAIVFALGFTGNMVQANSISDAFHNAFGVPKLVIGLATASVAAFIFLGGVRRIASFTEKVVPIMAIFYVLGCTALLIINHEAVPGALRLIFTSAFSTQAVFGGAAGITVQQAMRVGVAKGLFSNEAGMGSTPHAHALAKVKHPQEQGEIAMVSVFIDTFVVLTLTAMVILTSDVLGSGATGAALAQLAFSRNFGKAGDVFIALCMLFFAFSTIIGWYFFGEINFKALFGKKALPVYSIGVVLCVLFGSLQEVELVWNLSDLFNGLMVIPNLIAVLALSGLIVKISREDWEHKSESAAAEQAAPVPTVGAE